MNELQTIYVVVLIVLICVVGLRLELVINAAADRLEKKLDNLSRQRIVGKSR